MQTQSKRNPTIPNLTDIRVSHSKLSVLARGVVCALLPLHILSPHPQSAPAFLTSG